MQTLAESIAHVSAWFEAIPAERFFARGEGDWSPSDNVDHLIKSQRTLASALGLPKEKLVELFGLVVAPSRSYEHICEIYRQALADGGAASGRYLPDQQSPSPDVAESVKSDLLASWSESGERLLVGATAWGESDLDGYLLLHPLLGALTVREMLFFNIYHNRRHASSEGD